MRSHRVIGAIADDAAAAASFYTLGGEGFCVTRVCEYFGSDKMTHKPGEDAFHVVKLEKLRVVMTSARLGRKIDALAACGECKFPPHQ